jgi:hypothetical protein
VARKIPQKQTAKKEVQKMNTIETVRRAFDGAFVTWEYKSMPELVPNYNKILKKEYYNPYVWVITHIEKENTK